MNAREMRWKAGKFGIHYDIDDKTIIKPVAHFAKDRRLVSLINILGDEKLAINIHVAIGLDGEIYREDLCVCYRNMIDEIHPTIML